jgi:hypothetical protein
MGIDARPDWFQDKVSDNTITTHKLDADVSGNPFEFSRTFCKINTLEGIMLGSYGDYIIKGVQGEIYPCKPDIFEATYEAVLEDTPKEDMFSMSEITKTCA